MQSEAVNRGWIYPLNSVTHGQWDARATTTFLASPNFRCMLPMAMTQSFAGGVAKCRVLLILWMTSCSGCNKPRKDDASRREARIFTAHRYASAVYAVVVCPSVCCLSFCPSQAGVVSKRLDESSWVFFGMEASFHLSFTCKEISVSSKISVLPSGTSSQTPDIENFATASRSRCQQLVVFVVVVDGRAC